MAIATHSKCFSGLYRVVLFFLTNVSSGKERKNYNDSDPEKLVHFKREYTKRKTRLLLVFSFVIAISTGIGVYIVSLNMILVDSNHSNEIVFDKTVFLMYLNC